MSKSLPLRRIGVLTSGGDAPGMNAAVRAVVRSAIHKGWEVYAIRFGFTGLLAGKIGNLSTTDVSNIIQAGGTILKSARCPEFLLEENQERAIANLRKHRIESLVVIGGNGTLAGAIALARRNFPVVAIGATIDNDIVGSDVTIGVDTALNIALEAIDRLKVTAASHERAFLVEVMGRESGYLALVSGVAGGAEVIVVPEIETEPSQVADALRMAYEHGHAHAIAVVAEGAGSNAGVLAQYFEAHRSHLHFDLRITQLGHVQRGGAPTAFDRMLATRLGVAACNFLDEQITGVLIGVVGGEITATPMPESAGARKPLSSELLELAAALSY